MNESTLKRPSIILLLVVVLVGTNITSFYIGTLMVPPEVSPIPIGLVLPLTPPGGYVAGDYLRKAAEMAVEEINAAGGVLGRNITLRIGDTSGLPESGAAAIERLITEDKVVAVTGTWHSAVAVVMGEVTEKYGVPFVVASSSSDEISASHHETVFKVAEYISSSSKLCLVPFMDYMNFTIVTALGASTDVVIDQMETMADEIEAQDLDIEFSYLLHEYGATDFTAELLAIKNMDPQPDAMWIVSTLNPGLILKQMWELGIAPDVMPLGSWGWPSQPDYWDVTGEYGVGMVYYERFHPKIELSEIGVAFMNNFEEKYGFEAPFHTYLQYDSVYILADAIERAGSDSREAILNALKTTEFEGTLGVITFETDPDVPVIWQQWLGVPKLMLQYTAFNQTVAEAEIVYPPHWATADIVWPPS